MEASPIVCPHCLQALADGFHGDCPHCGKTLENQNPEGALPFGTQLAGKYTVGNYLSADGDGLAYRGVENEAKRFVLIKEYFPVTLCNGRSEEGALMPKEGREVLFKTSRMDFKDLYDDLHSLTPATGLSQILDVLEENNTVYAIEESEKGMTLTHYLSLRSRALTPAEARTLLQPVMEGVALLHKSGLIHRGICPDNILLPIDGTARLSGYGTLALRTGGSELKSQLYAGYAAPEQYSAAEFAGRYTDVYALAAVTYRLVTGQTPVAAPQRKVKDSMESAHSLEFGVPTYFSQVLSCAMRLDPARRMQTVPELMGALANPTVASTMFEKGENQISTKKILGASLAVIFVLAALLVWSLVRRPGEAQPSAGSQPTATQTPAGADAVQDDYEVIPNLVGKNYLEEIKESEIYNEYRIVVREEYDSDVPKGDVISQDPIQGSLKLEDRQVIELVVSRGPNLVDMPNILGFTQENAASVLDSRGIHQYSMLIYEGESVYPAGCVVKCETEDGEIQPGDRFDADRTIVTVYIMAEKAAPDPTPEPDQDAGTGTDSAG